MNAETVPQKAKRLAQESGLSYHEIGIRMGYPPKSARQSVSQFLKGTNPSLAILKRFAEALGVELTELL